MADSSSLMKSHESQDEGGQAQVLKIQLVMYEKCVVCFDNIEFIYT